MAETGPAIAETVAVGAAAAAGLGAGALSEAAGSGLQSGGRELRESAAEEGRLVLSVRATVAERQALARSIMRDAGASRIESVLRRHGTIEVT